jgi:hypothetical protein
MTYWLAALPPVSGILLVPKLLGVFAFALTMLLLSGEFKAEELGAARSLFRRPRGAGLKAPGGLL